MNSFPLNFQSTNARSTGPRATMEKRDIAAAGQQPFASPCVPTSQRLHRARYNGRLARMTGVLLPHADNYFVRSSCTVFLAQALQRNASQWHKMTSPVTDYLNMPKECENYAAHGPQHETKHHQCHQPSAVNQLFMSSCHGYFILCLSYFGPLNYI